MNRALFARKAGTLAWATAGGALAAWLGAPLPWMIGAMLATAAAALAHAPVAGPGLLRTLMIAVVGVGLGRLFTWDLLAQAALWSRAVSVMALTTATMGLAAYAVFRASGYGRSNAMLASAPGGITEMIAITSDLGLDTPRVSVAHATRILVSASTLPLAFRAMNPEIFAGPAAFFSGLSGHTASPGGLGALAVCALAGAAAGRLTRFPGGAFLFPMALAAGLTLTGAMEDDAGWPPALIAAAQIVLGAGIGARFAVAQGRALFSAAAAATLAAFVMLGVATGFAYLGDGWVGQSFALMTLALAPGGFIEMSLIAMAMGADPAFVALMHIARLFMVLLAAPALAMWARRALDAPPRADGT